jgi:hypothetical protein
MNRLKLSKTSWLILSAGIFVVILAGLGLTRSQQLREQTELDEALGISTARLNTLEVSELEMEEAILQQRLDESTAEIVEAKERLRQTVVSVDVTDEFFRIAEYSNVEVYNYGSTAQAIGKLGSVGFLITTINANVKGSTAELINFVINLNNGYTTGIVQTVSISIPEYTEEKESSATINMIVYSYEET